MKTQGVVFPEVNKYEVREFTLDDLGARDIRVRTLATAISPGTERWVLRGKHIGTRFPCVPGYHRVGVVEECGEQVREFEVGDVVYGCGNRWKEEDVVSMWSAHIGHSVGPEGSYRFLSSTMPSRFEIETLSFTTLAGVANRGIRFLDVQPTQIVVIIGAGILGVCAAQLAGLRGAFPILVEKDAERIAFVKNVVPTVFSVDDEDLEKKLKDMAPAGVNMLYDTVGHAPTTDRLVPLVRRQGKLLFQAQYFDKEKCAVDLDQIKIRELTVKTTCGTDQQDFFDTVTNIRARRLKIAPLISHRFDAPDDILKGYELLDRGKPFNLGVVFNWG